jgi:hypothetical protein
MEKFYTCSVCGDVKDLAAVYGYHAYYADGVTVIEIRARDKREARLLAGFFGSVLYVFE